MAARTGSDPVGRRHDPHDPPALGDARTGPDLQDAPIGPRTGETKTAEYTALNPRQKIPLLQDGDFRIGESAAIVAYLSRTYSTPERALIPETPRDYAAWLEWCFFIVAELDSTSLYVMRRHRADALGPSMASRRRSSPRPANISASSCAMSRRRWRDGRTVPDGRPVHQRRHPADDVPRLGDRLRRRHLRQRAALSRAHSGAAGLSARQGGQRAACAGTPVQPRRSRASCSTSCRLTGHPGR